MSKCPDCITGELTHDIASGLDQCDNRIECGYGWNDREADEVGICDECGEIHEDDFNE